jgi:glycine oxidase
MTHSHNQHPDVLILGGGVIGLTAALFLTRAGASVTVIDRGEPGRESSWAGAGILSPAPTLENAHGSVELLAAHSARLFPGLSEELRSTGIDNGHVVRGGWDLIEPDESPPLAEWRRQGIAFEEADEHLVSQREPALRPGLRRAFFLPATGQVRNPRHLKALLAWCGLHGVRILPGCPAHGFDIQQGRVLAVRTALGPLSAGKFLVASGAWTDTLLEGAGWCPGVRPVRGQIALLHSPAPLLSAVIERGKRYLVPRPDGRTLVGSTEEDAGFDKQTTAQAIAGLLDFSIGLVPSLAGASLERCWAGLRPGSPDGLPFLGAVPGLDNLFVAAGHYRSGIQLSPGTGLALSEVLLGKSPSFSLDAFRLDRETAFRP